MLRGARGIDPSHVSGGGTFRFLSFDQALFGARANSLAFLQSAAPQGAASAPRAARAKQSPPAVDEPEATDGRAIHAGGHGEQPLARGQPGSAPAVALAGRRRMRPPRRSGSWRWRAAAGPTSTISQRRRRAGHKKRDYDKSWQVPTTDNTDLVQPPKGAKPLEMGHFGKWTIMASTKAHMDETAEADVVGL